MRISVVTINKESGVTLERTLKSVLEQHYLDLEYLLIDGASQDCSPDVISKYEDTLAVVVSEPDSGISEALNKGIQRASGDLILCLNADDQLVSGALPQIADDWQKLGCPDVLCGAVRYLDPETGISFLEYPSLDTLHRYMTVFHPSMVVTRQAYERVGLYRTDYRLAMDSEWFHRATKMGLDIKTSENVYAIMSLQGVSDTRFRQALGEYRKSLRENGLARFSTGFYYWQQILFKTLMKTSWFKAIKYRADSFRDKKDLRKS